jgi:hypothetical protein
MKLFRRQAFYVFSARRAFVFLALWVLIPFPHECLSLIYGQSNCAEHGMICSCVVACNVTPRPLSKSSHLSDSGEACHSTTSKHEHEASSPHCSSELCSQNPQSQSQEDKVGIQLSNRAWLVGDLLAWTINLQVEVVAPVLFSEEIPGYSTRFDKPPRLNFS